MVQQRNLASVVVILSVLFISAPSSESEDPPTTTLHVTSVKSEEAKDWCTDGKCSATRYTVEGYADSVDYVLDCVQVMATEPSPHFVTVCSHVHANSDYAVKILSDAVSFLDEAGSSGTEPSHALYQIVSEKERTKRKQ